MNFILRKEKKVKIFVISKIVMENGYIDNSDDIEIFIGS